MAGGDLGVWKYFVPKSKFQWFIWMLLFSGPIKDALYAISKWVAFGFVSLLHYLKSLKKEPMNVKFDRLIGVDDIILEFQDVSSVSCFAHYVLVYGHIYIIFRN